MSNYPTLPLRHLAPLALLGVLLAGCDSAAKPDDKAPPAQVRVETVQVQPLAITSELSGRILAPRTAEVRARVAGVVLKRVYREGSDVKQGDVLFLIDPAPFKADLDSARATLARAEATRYQARLQDQRYGELVADKAVSRQEYDNAHAALLQADAEVAQAKAALDRARLSLGYATVTAPIAGRIGRALVTEGALVSATEATQMALIQQTDSVYLNITQSATELQDLRKKAGGKGIDSALPVSVVLDDGSVLGRKGRLLFSDVTVDPTSGQVTLRAQVSNEDAALLPGQYVRVRLSQAQLPSGILVPQQAVTRGGQNGDTLMVVGADNKPTPRPIKIASQQGENWVVVDGLKEGERVMVDGFQKLQMLPPGTPVQPVAWTPQNSATPPAAAGTPSAQPNAAGATATAAANAGGARTPSAGSPVAGATTPANSSR